MAENDRGLEVHLTPLQLSGNTGHGVRYATSSGERFYLTKNAG